MSWLRMEKCLCVLRDVVGIVDGSVPLAVSSKYHQKLFKGVADNKHRFYIHLCYYALAMIALPKFCGRDFFFFGFW